MHPRRTSLWPTESKYSPHSPDLVKSIEPVLQIVKAEFPVIFSKQLNCITLVKILFSFISKIQAKEI